MVLSWRLAKYCLTDLKSIGGQNSLIAVVLFFSAGVPGAADVPTNSTLASTPSPPVPVILTPKPAATPRINGPAIFGVRPGSPFLYTMPVTGSRPMKFSADNLPRGLKLDPRRGALPARRKSPARLMSFCARIIPWLEKLNVVGQTHTFDFCGRTNKAA
jgi:hypothetical protein